MLKGVLKLVWKNAKLSEVLEVFNFFMKGNGVAWLKTLKNGKLAEYSKQAADKGYQVIAHLMTTLNRIKTYIPRKHKDLHGKLDTLYRNLQEVKTRIHKAFADISSQLSEKIGKMLDESKGNAVEAQSKTSVKKQQVAKKPKISNNGSYSAEGDFGYLPPVRQKYVKDVYDLQKEVDAMRKAGRSPEEIARYASSRRDEIKKPVLETTSPEFLEKIRQRNLRVYGNESGPTIDFLRSQGKSWEQITEGATRAGGGDLF